MITLNKDHINNIKTRNFKGKIWYIVFISSAVISIVFLSILILSIINNTFGIIILGLKYNPETVSPGKPLIKNSRDELIKLLNDYSGIDDDFTPAMLKTLNNEKDLSLRTEKDLYMIFFNNVLQPEIIRTFSLLESVFNKNIIIEEYNLNKDSYPILRMEFKSWLNPGLFINTQSSHPLLSGIRTAFFGTLWMVFLTVLLAMPLGISAAIYLELYAKDNMLNRLIQVNIYNLAGVPSIIFGLLGLAVFVRMLEPVTSGQFLRFLFKSGEQTTLNGRTIISAGLTLAIMVLPIIIINTQEAIRAVPSTLIDSSYGLGATKWQTIWHHILPYSFDRILTGTILAVSRAIGETAPLVVVGASTFIVFDPVSIFSKFTVLPIQIYQWTARPQAEFRNLAASAIVVLLILLLTLNLTAIILRERTVKKRV
ncbi:MAG: phosphate ABC transporter permease PstA [Spirochaetes bacterium]|nr:phosphate ABC transporter permease PstA [Spirochaetota bacterium]